MHHCSVDSLSKALKQTPFVSALYQQAHVKKKNNCFGHIIKNCCRNPGVFSHNIFRLISNANGKLSEQFAGRNPDRNRRGRELNETVSAPSPFRDEVIMDALNKKDFFFFLKETGWSL